MINKQAVVLTLGTIFGMALAALLIALVALLMRGEEAQAEKYNDPGNDNDDSFYLDLSEYEPHQNIEGALVVIDTQGDDPRYYMMEGDDIETGTFVLINPKPEEEAHG